MNVVPVIERELRAEARHAMTYGLRLFGAGALLLIAALELDPNAPASQEGARLYARLHAAMLAGIWLGVPLVTADCISRERREGTLGLLFLTPLKAGDVVIAKSLAHGLRALMVWLAALPVLMIPILMGGINGQQALISVGVLASSFVLSLAAGVLASSWSKVWQRAMILALLFALIFFGALMLLLGLDCLRFLIPKRTSYTNRIDLVLVYGFFTIGSPTVLISYVLSRAPPAWQRQWLMGFCVISAVPWMVFLLVCWLSARNVRHHWQELPPSRLRVWFGRTFCTPFLLRNLLRIGMRWYLERNPIAWLELRRWSGRLVSWGWLAVLISLLGTALSSNRHLLSSELTGLLHLMAWALIISTGFSAAGSFRRERETGVLELLLVTPLRVGQIIGGRFKALLVQFLPSMLLLGVIWYSLRDIEQRAPSMNWPLKPSWSWPLYYGVTYLTLLVNGLYCSLRFRNYVAALSATFVSWLGPVLIGKLLGDPDYGLPTALLQLSLCVFLGWRLYARLERRGEALLN
jgi:ABC-type transport system involved in multi-copper enzyme maturation permease subunit